MSIITENDIDEELAKEFLSTTYYDIDLLPGTPENLTVNQAASILNISEPTIERMVQDGQLELTKSFVMAYINNNYLADKPLNLEQKTAPKSPVLPQIEP